MNSKPIFRRWWVWLLLFIFFLLLIGSILTSRYFNPWLERELAFRVQSESNGLYRLDLHGLDTSLLSGRISADSIHLIPDFDAWEQRREASQQDTTSSVEAPRALVDLKTQSLLLSGVNFLGILRGNPLDMGTLRVKRPRILITSLRQDTTDTHEPLHESVDGILKGLQINSIEIEDGALRIREGKDAKSDKILLENFTIRMKEMQLDSLSFQDEERAYYASRISFESGKAHFLLPDGTYRLQAAALKANTAEGTCNIGNLELVPLLKNAELARLKGKAVSTMRLKVPEINLSGVNYKVHSRHNNLVANHVVLKNPSLSAYMDRKNFPAKGDKPLPHDLIQELKTGLTIQKIEVQGMHIRYEELAEEAVETGVITFEDLFATITNVTNDKNRMSAKSPAVIDAKAKLNGDAPLAVTIRMDLLDPKAYHTIQGTAGPANPATLNSILESTSFISIKEGSLQKSDFRIELTRNKATGNLNVRYQNFKVDVLTKDEDKRQSFRKKILSRVANKVVIQSDNPKEGEELRAGDIEVVRAKSRSVFNYWKDCLVSGIRTAAGIEGVGADLQDPNR